MQKSDMQLAGPAKPYADTKANLEAVTGLGIGYIAVATDTLEIGITNGDDTWTWIGEGGGGGFTQEQIEDFIGDMFSGNTETRISATYDDDTGKINLEADPDFYSSDANVNTETITANKTLTVNDKPIQALFCSGGGYDVNLPIDLVDPLSVKAFFIFNISGSGGSIRVRSFITTVKTLQAGEAALFISRRTGWIVLASGQFAKWVTVEDAGSYFGSNITVELALQQIGPVSSVERVQDVIGAMFSGNTETGISADYDDTNGKINLVAEVTQAELDAVSGAIPTTEQIEDLVGAMFSGNTETGISADYDDTNGKINLVAEVTQAELDAVSGAIPTTEQIEDLVGAMFSGNTETGISATYDDPSGKINLVAEVTQAELDAVSTSLSGHVAAATDAHDASAISVDDSSFSNIEGDDVQELLADIDSQIGSSGVSTDGWIPISDTWTRTGDHTFTATGDVTAVYRKGARVRYKDGGSFEYGAIISSSHSAGTTTVQLLPNTTHAMAATTITDTSISYIGNPAGYPYEFAFTPSSWTNLTVGNGTVTGYVKLSVEAMLTLKVKVLFGSTTSISGTVSMDLPAPAASWVEDVMLAPGRAQDVSAPQNYQLTFRLTTATTGLFVRHPTSATSLTQAAMSASQPFTWATGDFFDILASYPI